MSSIIIKTLNKMSSKRLRVIERDLAITSTNIDAAYAMLHNAVDATIPVEDFIELVADIDVSEEAGDILASRAVNN